MWMMLVWFSAAQARASAAKAVTASSSCAISCFISFTATIRPSVVSNARNTVPMPPDAISDCSSNWRSCIGIMIGRPHLEHGVFSSGARSPEMNTLAPQCGHATSFSELRAGCIFSWPGNVVPPW